MCKYGQTDVQYVNSSNHWSNDGLSHPKHQVNNLKFLLSDFFFFPNRATVYVLVFVVADDKQKWIKEISDVWLHALIRDAAPALCP